MAGSEAPSHFTVHVFLNHHPVVARALLPDLFIDFPDLAWKLEPLEKQPPRPREKPPRSSVHHWVERRDQLGRYVFREPVAGDTTLLQLSEKMEREFDIAKRYQAQFTIFPQYFDEDGQYPQWHNRPMPWNMTLADIHPLDEDAGYRAAAGHALQTPIGDAPVIHLVLETKAAALTRILDTDFLGAHLGDAYKYFRDQWNRFDSYWHASLSGEDWPQLRSLLASWRVARAAHAYLTQQRAKGRLGAENEELKEHRQRVEEIRALKKQGNLSLLKERIRRLESNERNGREELEKMSWLVTQWEDWFVNRDFENFETRNLGPDDVKEKVMSVMRHSYRIVDGWISSERRQTLKVSIEEEYYANHPWLTEEDRAKSEEWRVEELKRRTQIARKAVTEDLTALTGDYLVPSQTIETHKFRGPDKKLLPDRASFTVNSGSLLWGQMIPLYTTLSNPNFTQNADHMPPALEGGTILQHRYSYRSAARNGRWRVRPFYERVRLSDAGNFLADPDAEELLGGWIVHHEDSDPMQILDRVRWTDGTGPGAVSNGNSHTDKVEAPLLALTFSLPVPIT